MLSHFSGRVAASHEWSAVRFPASGSSAPVVVSSLDTYRGSDTADVRMRGVDAAGMEVFVEEERSRDDETRHVVEDVGFFASTPGAIRDAAGRTIGEAGTTRRDQPTPDAWQSLAFDGRYNDPVVFVQVMSFNGDDPCHVRLRNVSSGSVEFKIEEWDYLNGPHTDEELGYVVLERGLHRLADDVPIEVGTITTTNAWIGIGFATAVGSDPVVVTRCQTANGSHAVVTRNRRVAAAGGEVRLQEELGRSGEHTSETVGYLIAPQIASPYAALRVASTHRWTDVDLPTTGPSEPVALTSIDTFNGTDTADVRLRNVSRGGAELFIEEEASRDSEMEHVEEAIGVFRIRAGPLFDADGNRVGEAGFVDTDQPGHAEWHSVRLDRPYRDPIAFAQVMTYEGVNPCHVRLRNVAADSFDFRIEEWDYLDGRHDQERVGYLVLERGTHDLAAGGTVVVGATRGDDGWTGVAFEGDVGSDPVLISRCQTFNGPNEVVTRNRSVTSAGAEIRLQEEQGQDGRHDLETIGFLAAPRGRADLTTGLVTATEEWSALRLTGIPSTEPVVLASVATFDGANTVGVRLRNVGSSGFELFLEEETSGDEETAHTTEEVGIFATGTGPLVDASGAVVGEAGTLDADQPDADTWRRVDLDHSYDDPVVLMQVMSYNGNHPCHTRLRNVDGNGFEYRIEEWKYLDGRHDQERIGYVVLEKGVHRIEGEIPIVVGDARVEQEFQTVSFPSGLRCDPVFLTHCQTFNGSDPVVIRAREVKAHSAKVRLQEEEARGGRHHRETVGYVAAPQLILGKRRSIDQFHPSCHGFNFANSFNRIPELPNLPGDLNDRLGRIRPEYGLCGGMALAARDFFLHDRPIPAADEPPQSGPLFDYLWQRLIDTFDPSHGWRHLRKFLNFYLPSTFTRARSVSELRSLTDALDAGRPAVLGLIYVRAGQGNPWNNHQVLAYDYSRRGDTTHIYVYDPNQRNKNDVEIKVNLREQGVIDPRPGGQYIEAAQYRGTTRQKDVIGLIHVHVPPQNPPAHL